MIFNIFTCKSLADPDLELSGGEGAVLFACPAGFSSFCDFFFIQNKEGGVVDPAPPPDPPEDNIR